MGECLFAVGAIVMVLLLIGFMIFTIVAASYDDCQASGTLPPDSTLNLTMQDWLITQLMTSIIILGLFSGFAKTKSSNGCMIAVIVAVLILYILFEEVWSIIGLVLFEEYYQDACQNAENFNSYVTAEIISGLCICSLILLTAIFLACREWGPKINWRVSRAAQYQPAPGPALPVFAEEPVPALISDEVAATPQNVPQSNMTDEQLAESQSALMYLYNRISRNKDEPNERYSRIN